MIELNEQQRQELGRSEPIAIDPATKQEYVLVRREVYGRLKGLLDEDTRVMEPLLADLDPEDWEDASNFERAP
jgi:hypothetical protein